jgi:hypothetical protein
VTDAHRFIRKPLRIPLEQAAWWPLADPTPWP